MAQVRLTCFYILYSFVCLCTRLFVLVLLVCLYLLEADEVAQVKVPTRAGSFVFHIWILSGG